MLTKSYYGSYVIFLLKKRFYIYFLLIKFSLFYNFIGKSIAEKYSNPYTYPDEIITIYTLLYLNQFSSLLANRNIAQDPRGTENRQEQRIIILL